MKFNESVRYPSTNQFKDTIRFIQNAVRFDGFDEEGKPKYNQNKLPTIRYRGTIKLHGTNGSLYQIPRDEELKTYCGSKERILDISHDNAGFFEAMQTVPLDELFQKFKDTYKEVYGTEATYPIRLAGEWAGGNIQSSVAINGVPKFFTIFGFSVGGVWLDANPFKDIHLNEHRIFNALQFEHHFIDIDFENPQLSQNALIDLTEKVEQECPVGKFFGKTGIGEGIVWVPADSTFISNSSSWFKVKGKKHSSSKVRVLAAVDEEKLSSISAFVDYACTENRMLQGIQEVGLDLKLTGSFIGWVNRDIFK